jgi:hypothetical protein
MGDPGVGERTILKLILRKYVVGRVKLAQEKVQ